jgi:HK97 family phage major capsid protein
MNTSEKVLNGIKQALTEGKATVKLSKEKAEQDVNEASQLTGSGLDKGGRTYFDDAFAALRLANPFRGWAREVTYTGSAAQFVAKTGNVLNQTGSNNPWGYTFTPNDGTPGISTSIWQLPTRNISAQLPLRTALLSDINYIDETIVSDLVLEFSQAEASSMALNVDQAGSTTYTTGATNGLRGLITYPGSTSAASYGSSGTAITNGLHTVIYEAFSPTAPTYEDLVNTLNKLPPQYWYLPSTAWMMHPSLIAKLRLMTATGGLPLLLEVGDKDGGSMLYLFGIPVIPNSYFQTAGAGAFMGTLACWDQFMTIADNEEMTLKRYDQTKPGFVTLYAEKRVVSTVRNPTAGVFIYAS